MTARELRADAERNRRRILSAARELFAVRGLEVSLDEIAAHAGVGVGTVYRRFADRDALIDAIFEERIGEIAEAARRALENGDPWEAFTSFLREATGLQAADRGLREALLSRGAGRERVERARATIAPLVAELVQRAQEAGRLRADLGTFDVPMVPLMIGAVADAARDVAPDVWERFLGLVLDGLSQSRAEPTRLAAEPLSGAQFASIVSQGDKG